MERAYKFVLISWLAVMFLVIGQVPCHAQASAGVAVLTVQGAIDPIIAEYIERGIRTVAADGAQCVILVLDTPGGLDLPMREIVKTILAAPLPVIAYVSPQGARAASAGLFIAYACPVIAMAPGTNIGAAHPVDAAMAEVPKALEEKVVNDAVAYLRSLAQQQNHNPDWAEKAIRESASLSAEEAVSEGVANLVAATLDDLVDKLDGLEVRMARDVRVLHTLNAQVRRLGMNLPETILHVIVNPTIAYLLLTIGIWGLIAEFSAPGISAGGIIGVICLIMFGISVASLPLNWAGLALIALSIALFILDIKAPTHGLLTAGGIGAFVLGSLFLFSPMSPRAPAMIWPSELFRIPRWLIGVMTVLTAGIFSVAVGAGIRAQRLRPAVGMAKLVGAIGIVKTDCNPLGTVQVQGELWSAIAEQGQPISGDTVRVVGLDGLRLRVRKVESSEE